MLKIKQLVWTDNTTDLGKEVGYVYLIAKEPNSGINYIITNRSPEQSPSDNVWGDKFYMSGIGSDFWGSNTIVDSIEEAKTIAQKDFEGKVLERFFEEIPAEETPEGLNKQYIDIIIEMRKLNKERFSIESQFKKLVPEYDATIMRTPSLYHDLFGKDLDEIDSDPTAVIIVK